MGWRDSAEGLTYTASRHQQLSPRRPKMQKHRVIQPDLPLGFLDLLVGPFRDPQ